MSNETTKQWHKNNKEYFIKYKREWRQKNKERENKKKVDRYNQDINYRLKDTLRARLTAAIKNNQKSGSAIEDLGCSVEEFKAYLEAQFESWMNWDNYGRISKTKDTWQIDHIIPLSSFDLTDIEQLKKACHFTNLRPLKAKDNILKSNKIIMV